MSLNRAGVLREGRDDWCWQRATRIRNRCHAKSSQKKAVVSCVFSFRLMRATSYSKWGQDLSLKPRDRYFCQSTKVEWQSLGIYVSSFVSTSKVSNLGLVMDCWPLRQLLGLAKLLLLALQQSAKLPPELPCQWEETVGSIPVTRTRQKC